MSGRVLYSRGYDSVYGEWVTTPEAAKSVERALGTVIDLYAGPPSSQ